MANYYFHGINGDWDDITKWYLDVALTIPAGSLPTINDDVFVDGLNGDQITNATSAVCNNLNLQNVSVKTTITVNGIASFQGSSSLDFDGVNDSAGVIMGNAEFLDSSYINVGTVIGNIHFYDSAYDTISSSANNLYLHSPYNRDISLLYGTYTDIIYQDYTLYLSNASWWLDSGATVFSPNGPTSTDDVVVLDGGFDISGISLIWIGMLGAAAKNLTLQGGLIYNDSSPSPRQTPYESITLNNSSYIANDASIQITCPITFNDNGQNLGASIIYPATAPIFNDNSKNFGTIGDAIDPIGATINFPVKLPLGGNVYGGITYVGYNPLSYNNNILGII